MKVRILGAHNREAHHARHTCFLVDGLIAVDAGSLMTALSPEEQRGIRAILLTHRHFDHIRDLPSLGLATLDNGRSVSVYSLAETLETTFSRLMDGVLYPDFSKSLTQDGPKYRLQPVTPGEALTVEGYTVRPIAVPHAAPTVGYVVHQPEGGSFAYCGDTGGGLLPFFQDPLKPDPLFVEVTFAKRQEERAKNSGHLTADLLRNELVEAVRRRLTIPRIMIVHRNPDDEDEITEELSRVSAELGIELPMPKAGAMVEV